jgi:hypothetical protein
MRSSVRVPYNASVVHLTEKEIAADVKLSAMEEGSDKELGEPHEYTIKKKLLGSARNDIYAVINCEGYSTNRKLQAYYERLTTVKEILMKEKR